MGSTILLADKSVTIQKIVELTFADQNFVIRSVNDGQAALDLIPQLRPDLILADISLPVRNGYEICQALRNESAFSEFSKIPVILLAGIYDTMDEDRARQVEEKAKQAGATELLSKPFDPQTLTSRVSELLSNHETPVADEAYLFAESMNVPASSMDTPAVEEPPADDSERTMILPKSTLMQNIFADAPVLEPVVEEPAAEEPVEEFSVRQERPPLNVEAISPAYEPVFDEQYLSAEEEVPVPVEEPVILIPPAEEPFGEVFEEQASWTTSAASEEESPFGVPEPPPAPKVPEAAVITQPVAIPEVETEQTQAGEVGEVTPAETEVPSVETVGESIVEETFEDSWPGVANDNPPLEELFEPEPPAKVFEEQKEPQQDLTKEAEIEQSQTVERVVEAAQITDELIEKIAERVVRKLSERFVSDIVWQVVPDLAEKMIRREIEKLHAGEE